MKQIEKIGRAQKGSYDSCPDLAAGKDPSPHKVTEREEYSPNQGGKRQETMVVGPAQKTSHMGNDEPNKPILPPRQTARLVKRAVQKRMSLRQNATLSPRAAACSPPRDKRFRGRPQIKTPGKRTRISPARGHALREAVPRLPKVQKKYCCMMGAGAKLRSPDTRAAQKKLTATPPKRRYVTEALKERRPKRATKKRSRLHP